MPKVSPTPNRLVAALAYDGLCAFEFGITAEVFGLPRPEMGTDWYKFAACTEPVANSHAAMQLARAAIIPRRVIIASCDLNPWHPEGSYPGPPHATNYRIGPASRSISTPYAVTPFSPIFAVIGNGRVVGKRVDTSRCVDDVVREAYDVGPKA